MLKLMRSLELDIKLLKGYNNRLKAVVFKDKTHLKIDKVVELLQMEM